MNEMFGISMNTIMFVLLGFLLIALLSVLLIFLRNRIIFMLGLRNIPRRRSQTVLIIIGLMLSTVIITAAFTTGDTVDYSVTKQAYDLLGHADIILDGEVAGAANSGGTNSNEIPGDDYQKFLDEMDAADIPNVDGYAGMLIEFVPVINQTTNLSEPDVSLTAVDAARADAFPDFFDADSGAQASLADLGDGEVFVNESAADELEAKPGDVLDIFRRGRGPSLHCEGDPQGPRNHWRNRQPEPRRHRYGTRRRAGAIRSRGYRLRPDLGGRRGA